jgi:hypothetical protein
MAQDNAPDGRVHRLHRRRNRPEHSARLTPPDTLPFKEERKTLVSHSRATPKDVSLVPVEPSFASQEGARTGKRAGLGN